MDPMPGWELTQGWMTEEGLPARGVLQAEYYSGGGEGLRGCEAKIALRKAFLSLTMIEEQDMCDEIGTSIYLSHLFPSIIMLLSPCDPSNTLSHAPLMPLSRPSRPDSRDDFAGGAGQGGPGVH